MQNQDSKQNSFLLFGGYCPECALNHEPVEMKLNNMDFYECETTGLQVCIMPPHAVILRWRGQGKFRSTTSLASDDPSLDGLVLCAANAKPGKEIFPADGGEFSSDEALSRYLHGIFKTHEEYKSSLTV